MAFLFSEIMNLPQKCDVADFDELKTRLPDTPDEIIQDFYADHGRKPEFQEQYGKLDLQKITWEKIEVAGQELINAGIYPAFKAGRVDICATWIDNYDEDGWNCVSLNKNISSHWKKHKTWMRKPIFITGGLIGEECHYRLVEGHSRLGILKGLTNKGIISPEQTHEIWYGTEVPAPKSGLETLDKHDFHPEWYDPENPEKDELHEIYNQFSEWQDFAWITDTMRNESSRLNWLHFINGKTGQPKRKHSGDDAYARMLQLKDKIIDNIYDQNFSPEFILGAVPDN